MNRNLELPQILFEEFAIPPTEPQKLDWRMLLPGTEGYIKLLNIPEFHAKSLANNHLWDEEQFILKLLNSGMRNIETYMYLDLLRAVRVKDYLTLTLPASTLVYEIKDKRGAAFENIDLANLELVRSVAEAAYGNSSGLHFTEVEDPFKPWIRDIAPINLVSKLVRDIRRVVYEQIDKDYKDRENSLRAGRFSQK